MELNFDFKEKASTCEAFILPNKTDISITASTSIIDGASWKNDELSYEVLAPGSQEILWNKKYGKPSISKQDGITLKIEEIEGYYRVLMKVERGTKKVVLKQKK